jgi:hypothetical protein
VKNHLLIFSTGEWKWEYRPSPRGDTTPRDSSTDLYSLPEESLQEATQETAQEATQEDVQEHFRFDRAIPNLGVDNITQGIRDTTVNTNTQASSSYKGNIHYLGFQESCNSVPKC